MAARAGCGALSGEGAAVTHKPLITRPILKDMAETEGFEPSVPYSQYDGLANRWFQPLTHVSKHGLNARLGRDSG